MEAHIRAAWQLGKRVSSLIREIQISERSVRDSERSKRFFIWHSVGVQCVSSDLSFVTVEEKMLVVQQGTERVVDSR
jgi:hypothetical protein